MGHAQPPAYENAYPLLNPLDKYRSVIAQEIARITGADGNVVFSALDRTTLLESGDLLLAVPRLRVKGVAPNELAASIAQEFDTSSTDAPSTSVADGIYVRFFFSQTQLPNIVVPQILHQRITYGKNPNLGLRDKANPGAGPKRTVVEFSSPNIAKKFHFGHLRSTIIGGFLATLHEHCGYDVVRLNYLGDWGRQFGLLACGWERYGNEEAFARDAIAHLFEIYVRISADFKPEEDAFNEAKARGEDTSLLETQGLYGDAKSFFKRMEDRDEKALELWRRFRALSIVRYKESYARLNIAFDDYSGESEVRQETMKAAEEALSRQNITESDKGASLIDFKKHGAKALNVAIIRNRNGTSNYLLRDIGSAVQRQEKYVMDEMIYVVMSEQDTHLKWLFKTLELMGGEYTALSKKMRHITFGKVMGMSTRRGTVRFLDDIITDVADFMHDVMRRNEVKYAQVPDPEATAETLAVSAVLVQDMTGKRVNNYEFSLERMTSFEGDTGPYLQYAHARLCSIFRNLDYTDDDLASADLSHLSGSTHATNLLRMMARYPDMVVQALKTLEPTTILTYLFKLTHVLSSSYDHLRVVGAVEGREVSVARAALYKAARQVLSNGMSLLGLTPVERM